MIKMIVLDVDGVIVGNQPNNFPYPDKKVIAALKQIKENGIPVVLCSGKYYSAIEPIIHMAHLDNPQITDSGALIIDPLSDRIISISEISKEIVFNILSICITNKIHTEAFSDHEYYMQEDQIDDFTKKRTPILQKEPVAVNSLPETVKDKSIIKIITLADDKEKIKIEKIIEPYLTKINFVWTTHPKTGSLNYGLITSKTASKALALIDVAKSLNVSLRDALGVGDTMGDWEFMKACGYTATMTEAPDELKKLVQFTAPSVNDNGILQILDHFLG